MDSNDDVVGAVKTRSKRITAGSVFSFNMSQTVEVEQPLPISWPFYGQVHFERNLGRVKFLRKLKDNIHQLSLVYGDLSRKDAEIRLKLRCHRGHRGKVNNTVIVWLEQVERTAKKFNSITSQLRKTSRSKFYSLQILVVAKKVVKLIDEVKFLVESAASLIFFNDRNGAERGPGKMTSLVGQMAQKISSQIWTHLTDPSIRTICLYGLGGVGKTTMMRNINSELASTAIFDEIIWATLSKNVNWEKVQDDIAQQLGIELPATRQVEVRAKTIFEHVKSVERCLFIIDDVWESLAFDLETMGIPEGEHKGCKIVFTTRFLRVGRFMRVDKNIKLAPLSESEAWELFVSKSGNQVLNSNIQNTAKEVLIACLGLPITIITVGHAMRDKVSGTAWSSALRDLQSTQHETQRAVENLLRFGFRHLKNDQVRSCFLYCAFFPEDFKFEPKELIEYWMAEDFITNKEGILRAVDDGFEILKDLKDANMLEILVEGGTEWLKMHDLFRDLAIAIMTEEFDYLMKPGLKIKEFPRILEYVRAKKISLIRNEIERLEIVCFCSKLSTLLLKDNPLSHISFSFFSQMPSLQFVDLSYSGITQLPPPLCELPKLRVLFLQYCTSLQKIPSVKDLRELQVFSLRGTLIKELPHGMKDLVSLKSLDLSETVRLELIEVGVVSSLTKLEELQMQGSRLCRMESSTTVKCFNEIRNLKNLIILTLSAVGFGDYLETILYLQEHSLKSFSINVYGSTHDYSDDI